MDMVNLLCRVNGLSCIINCLFLDRKPKANSALHINFDPLCMHPCFQMHNLFNFFPNHTAKRVVAYAHHQRASDVKSVTLLHLAITSHIIGQARGGADGAGGEQANVARRRRRFGIPLLLLRGELYNMADVSKLCEFAFVNDNCIKIALALDEADRAVWDEADRGVWDEARAFVFVSCTVFMCLCSILSHSTSARIRPAAIWPALASTKVYVYKG